MHAAASAGPADSSEPAAMTAAMAAPLTTRLMGIS
jgi:hypothetical protein